MQIMGLIPWGRKDSESWHKPGDEHLIVTLQRDMNQIFDTFWRSFDRPFESLNFPWESGMPRCDVVETDKVIEVSVDLPGLEENRIDVLLTDDVLTIKGEQKAEREENRQSYCLAERYYGSLSRTIPLPSGVDREKIVAKFKNGVLTVTLPKTAEVQTRMRKIPVNVT